MATKTKNKKKSAPAVRPCEFSETTYALVNSQKKIKSIEMQAAKLIVLANEGPMTVSDFKNVKKELQQTAEKRHTFLKDADIETSKRNGLRELLLTQIPAANKWFLTENGKYAIAKHTISGEFDQVIVALRFVENPKPEHLPVLSEN